MRDKISHGDFTLDSLDKNYSKACHLFVILILKLLYYFQKSNIETELIKTEDKDKNYIELKHNYKNLELTINNYINNYEIQFHPKSFILKNTKNLIIEIYTIYHYYNRLMIKNPQLFTENFSTINEASMIATSTIYILVPSNDDQNNILFKIFQPSYFYSKNFTIENIINNYFPQLQKIISSRLYGTAQEIRFYNACSRILWLCYDKILNSLNNYIINIINSCLNSDIVDKFDLTNNIKIYKEKIISTHVSKINDYKNFEKESNDNDNDNNNSNNNDNDNNNDSNNDNNDYDIYGIPGTLNVTTRRRKKLKDLPKYMKETIDCCLFCGLTIGWFISHENYYFSLKKNESDDENLRTNDKFDINNQSFSNSASPQQQQQQQQKDKQNQLNKLFKLIYKLEVFCERISANIEKGTLNSINHEYQMINKSIQSFILSI
eukprot:jgi/Orpsp1_1/1182126/evm.model.c7180000080004.1